MTRQTRSGRLLLAAAAALVVAVGALARPALGAIAAVPHCSSQQLRLEFVEMQGAAGHRYIDYAFKNVGAVKCSLRGYPSAVVLNKHGHAIRSGRAKVTRWSLSPVRTVVIRPGQRGFFTFTWVFGGNCPGHAFTFHGLRVVPPHAATAFRWHLGYTSACDSSAKVSAVRPKLFPF